MGNAEESIYHFEGKTRTTSFPLKPEGKRRQTQTTLLNLLPWSAVATPPRSRQDLIPLNVTERVLESLLGLAFLVVRLGSADNGPKYLLDRQNPF